MTTAPAKSPPSPLAALDNASALVLERVASLDERLANIEHLLRKEASPTSTAHHLLALEESMLNRLKMMSEVMTLLLHRCAEHLSSIGEGDSDFGPEHMLKMFETLQPRSPTASKGRDAAPQQERRPSKR